MSEVKNFTLKLNLRYLESISEISNRIRDISNSVRGNPSSFKISSHRYPTTVHRCNQGLVERADFFNEIVVRNQVNILDVTFLGDV